MPEASAVAWRRSEWLPGLAISRSTRPARSAQACSLEHSPPGCGRALRRRPCCPPPRGAPCRWCCRGGAARPPAGSGARLRRPVPTSRASISAANGGRRSAIAPARPAGRATARRFGISRATPHPASTRAGFAAPPASATPIGRRQGVLVMAVSPRKPRELPPWHSQKPGPHRPGQPTTSVANPRETGRRPRRASCRWRSGAKRRRRARRRPRRRPWPRAAAGWCPRSWR